MARELTVAMEPELYDAGLRVAMPTLRARLRRGARVGPRYGALVDSGSTLTVARMEIAAHFGLDPDAVKGSLDRQSVAGASGEDPRGAWGWEFELQLGDGGVSSRIVLPGARVYFVEEWRLSGFDLVLGAHDALERLTFTLANHAPEPSFTLRVPTRR